jgi:hypothetical protein
MNQEWIIPAVGVFLTVLGYLLKQKDDKQQKELDLLKTEFRDSVETLWVKHDADAKELDTLKLQIAQQHYVKSELDAKFDRMEDTFREGFKDMSNKFEHLSQVLLNTLQEKK